MLEKKCNSEISHCGFQHQDLSGSDLTAHVTYSDQCNWPVLVYYSTFHTFREVFIKQFPREGNINTIPLLTYDFLSSLGQITNACFLGDAQIVKILSFRT